MSNNLEEVTSKDLKKMKTVSNEDLVMLLGRAKAQMLEGISISQLKIRGFKYIGKNVLENKLFKFEGDIQDLVFEEVGDIVEDFHIFWGVRLSHSFEDGENSVNISVKVKAYTKHEVFNIWVKVASEVIK